MLDKQARQDYSLLQAGEWAYLNSAAQTLAPAPVLAAMQDYYIKSGANVHRGVDTLGYLATQMFEDARQQVARLLGAKDAASIVFTRGATAALNLACFSYGGANVHEGDEIVTSIAEHHANFVPWQQLALQKKAVLKFAPLEADGSISVQGLKSVLSPRTKIVALHHISNVMGSCNDLKALAAAAHEVGAVFVADGAQGASHQQVDVVGWDVDFYAIAGHKLLGPTGVGALYAKPELLKDMPPIEFGGEMIHTVGLYETTFEDAPYRFEAGTPMIAQAIGLGAAIRYFYDHVGYTAVHQRVGNLRRYALDRLQSEVPGIHIYNPHNDDSGLITFNIEGVHAHDVASVLDKAGVCVRAGHHCAQPILSWLNTGATVRASLYYYNNQQDVDRLTEALKKAGDFIDVLF